MTKPGVKDMLLWSLLQWVKQAASVPHAQHNGHSATIWHCRHVQGPDQEAGLLRYVDKLFGTELVPAMIDSYETEGHGKNKRWNILLLHHLLQISCFP